MKFVFFSPFTSSMWNMSLIERAIYNNLKEDNEIFIINCDEDLNNHCIAFNAAKLDNYADKNKKKRVCKICIKNKNILNKNILNKNIKTKYNIKDLLSENDYSEIKIIVDDLNLENFNNITVFDIEVGKIALHDFILINKLSTLKTIEKDWVFYKNIFRSTLLSLFAFKNFIKKHKVDFVISTNNLYSSNQVVAKYANKNGIKSYSLNPNSNVPHKQLQYVKIWEGIKGGLNHYALINWDNQKFYLTDENIKQAFEYVYSNILGTHYLNFSKPKNKKNIKLLVDKSKNYKKIITVILSGIEEDFCLESSDISIKSSNKKKLFLDQLDWLSKIIDFSKKNKEFLLIIRPHPREWLKRKNNEYSENYHHLKNLFDSIKNDNCIVDYPELNNSIYDYIQITDLFLTNGSSSFVDFSILGFPIVDAGLDKLQYPHNQKYNYDTIDEYFKKVKEASNSNRSLRITENYIRWFVWTNIFDTINIQNQVSKNENRNITNFIYKSLSKLLEIFNIYYFKKNEINNLKKLNKENKIKLKNLFQNKESSVIKINFLRNANDNDKDIVERNIENIKKKINDKNIFNKLC